MTYLVMCVIILIQSAFMQWSNLGMGRKTFLPQANYTWLAHTGLIDYNFHCFKKAIEEVFDVRLKVQRSRKLLSQRRWSRQTVPNGTQVHPHWRALKAPWSVTVTPEWRLHTDFTCALNLLQGHLLLFSNSKWRYRFH